MAINTYESAYNGRMDCLHILVGSHRSDNDWWLDIQRSIHTFPDMGPHISDEYKPSAVHIRH